MAGTNDLTGGERSVKCIPDREDGVWSATEQQRRSTDSKNIPDGVLDLSVVPVVIDAESDVRQPQRLGMLQLSGGGAQPFLCDLDVERIGLRQVQGCRQVDWKRFALRADGRYSG